MGRILKRQEFIPAAADGGKDEIDTRKKVPGRDAWHVGNRVLATEEGGGPAGTDRHRPAELLHTRVDHGVVGEQEGQDESGSKRLRSEGAK